MTKPTGQWKCRACGKLWDGNQLYADPQSTANRWTCGNLSCGGTCDPLSINTLQEFLESHGVTAYTITRLLPQEPELSVPEWVDAPQEPGPTLIGKDRKPTP